MYYYSLEKYYKKSESLNIASPTETLKKVLAPSDLPHNEPELNLPRSRKEKSNITTGLNKELFKRIRVINPDFSEALETVFSYQFTLNGFTLELVKMFEKIAHSLGNVMKPGGPDNTAPQKYMRSPSMVTSPSCKTVKYPLEMEVNSILYNVQKLHEELFSLVTEVIPKREKSLSKGRPARGSNAATPSECSPSKKRQSIPVIAETTKPLNKSSVASKRPSKMQTSKTKVNLHELFEQDQKENNEASQLMSSSSSSRNLNLQPMNSLSQLKVSVARNVPSSTRNSTNNKDNRILGKRGVNLSTGPLEATSTILTDLKNESKRNISDKFSGKLELDILPKKELEDEDETISLTSGIPKCENLQTVGNQKSPLETTLCKTLATKARDEHVEITKKEKNVIKHLLSVQSRAINSPSKRGDQPLLCQKRYLIGARWWTAWKEYVNFDSNVADESKCLAQVYPRPGMIINHDLLNQEDMNKDSLDSSSIGLKDHLLEHHDFEAVSKEVFEILAIWYGCDYEVIRLLRPDPSHPDRFFLDLFPKRRLRRTANQKSMPDNLLLMKK